MDTDRRRQFVVDITYFGRNYKEIYDNFYRGRELYITEEIRKSLSQTIGKDLEFQGAALAEKIIRENHSIEDVELISYTRTLRRCGNILRLYMSGEFLHSISAYYDTSTDTREYIPVQVCVDGCIISRQSDGICVFDPPIYSYIHMIGATIEMPTRNSCRIAIVEIVESQTAGIRTKILRGDLVDMTELCRSSKSTEGDIEYSPLYPDISTGKIAKACSK
jgi:hypothetical protein